MEFPKLPHGKHGEKLSVFRRQGLVSGMGRGAAADSWFSHLAVEVVADGASNEWLEAVSEEKHGRL